MAEFSIMPKDSVDEFRSHLNHDELIKLSEAFGGQRLYIPRDPRAGQNLVGVLGMEAALRLSKSIGGLTFRVPANRDALIKHYRAQGLSTCKIAKRVGMTENGVQKALARMARREGSGERA